MIVTPQHFNKELDELEAMLRKLPSQGYEGEQQVNVKLLPLAAVARQAMNYVRRESGDASHRYRVCGRYHETIPGGKPRQRPLIFFRACGSILHAGGNYFYDFASKQDPALLTIFGEKGILHASAQQWAEAMEEGEDEWGEYQFKDARRENILIKSELYCMGFIGECRTVSGVVARLQEHKRRGGEVQDSDGTEYMAGAGGAAVLEPPERKQDDEELTQTEADTAEQRDIYIYDFDVDNKVVEVGATRDLRACEEEVGSKYGGWSLFIDKMSPEPMTRAEAERELKELAAEGWPVNMESLENL